MHSSSILSAAAASALFPSILAAAVPRADGSDPKTILNQLHQAPSRIDQLKALVPDPKNAQNLMYKLAPTEGPGAGNGVAEIHTFPALDITTVGMAVGTVVPCGLNLPHIHPRATEFFVVLEGSLEGGVALELGSGPLPPVTVNTTLTKFVGTIFPQGAVHFQFNPTCEEASFFNSFDSNDPGFAVPGIPFEAGAMINGTTKGTTKATLSKRDLEFLSTGSVGPKQLPRFRDQLQPEFVKMIETCAARCGMGKQQ